MHERELCHNVEDETPGNLGVQRFRGALGEGFRTMLAR